MKVRVQRRDGDIETIDLVGPAEIHHGEAMDHIHSSDGMDYYFVHTGHYDGWGKAVSGITIDVEQGQPGIGALIGETAMAVPEIAEAIERVERERRIEPPETPA